MKFFHLSDLHIGLKLINHDLREDQEYILGSIVKAAGEEKPDAIVIAGDIYDKAVPSAEAVDVFDQFISDLSEEVPDAVVMMISGNHDSASRVNCFRRLLSRQNLHMVGQPPRQEGEYIERVVLRDGFGPVNFYLLPFVKPSMVKQVTGVDDKGNNLSYDATVRSLINREDIREKERNVLVSHQFYLPRGKSADDVERMDSEIRTVGNIDQVSADVLKPFDYAALGHIHKPMKVGDERYRYCGTPLPCSISEAGQQKGILVVEMGEKKEGPARINIRTLPLVPLRQIRKIEGELRQVLEQACPDYVSVLLTDKVDLDVIDMQERLRLAFPRLLEIRRETLRRADYSDAGIVERTLNPFELCCEFFKDINDREKDILRDVIHQIEGVK